MLPAIVTFLGCALFAWLWWRVQKWRASRHAKIRARRAARGESAAEQLLAARGYAIEDTQVRLAWTFHCDGEPVTVALRCDAIVSRDGRRFVAEVKTGERAPALDTAATRRQLLEYAIAYDADGVLLVEPEAGVVREIDFGVALRRAAC